MRRSPLSLVSLLFLVACEPAEPATQADQLDRPLTFTNNPENGNPRAAAALQCGAQVDATGGVTTVLPTGSDDTANLQCALDAAASAGRRTHVRLLAGTYFTRQLVATGFRGTLRGAGADATVVRNLDSPLFVTPLDFYVIGAPSATNPWPFLLAFIGGDFEIRDLAVRIVGATPTTGWSIFEIPSIVELAGGIGVFGDEAHARIERVLIEGEDADGTLFGYNLINGIYYEGFIGPDLRPISGDLTVQQSTFRSLGSGVPVSNVRNARVAIIGNRFENVALGAEVADLDATQYEMMNNEVDSWLAGLSVYDLCLGGQAVCGLSGSRLKVHNNTIGGGPSGILLEATHGAGVRCHLSGNNVAGVTELAIHLGAGTQGCRVVNPTPGALIIDDGTGNTVISR